jgi:crossover junction endodeoxyribonuclease RusA
MKYAFRLDWPPTINHYWKTRCVNGRPIVYATPAAKAYREAAADQRPTAPLLGRLAVSLELTMPDRRRRDIDNAAKAVLDAISHAGIWQDDSQIDKLLIERIGIEKPGCVDVVIEQLGGENGCRLDPDAA